VFRSSRNASHHYDIDHRLYRLFLDGDWQYSCAYFERPNMSIDEAQEAKKRHIAAKLLLDRPGLRVLDIGSGWGGLAFDLARSSDASVMGITLAQEQMSEARKRAEAIGLARQTAFELIDYRNVVLASDTTSASEAASQSRRAGTIDYRVIGKPEARRPDGSIADRPDNRIEVARPFDRIVSVGMFEHVGVPFYGAFLGKCRELLADDGVMLLHTIGKHDGPSATNPWVDRYIFPGGYTPALSQLTPVIERSGLIITDIEVLRLHYAETLKLWRQRFLAQREQVLKIADDGKPLFDERFLRMWEFYLAGFEPAFRYGGLTVFQIQMTKKIDAVPLTRNYIYEPKDARSARVLKAV
jgi:cyclopropane-fatty-acyl-phospholipid synthase